MSTSLHFPVYAADPSLTVLLRRAVTDLRRWLGSRWAAGLLPGRSQMTVVCVAGEGDGRETADLISPIQSDGESGLSAVVALGPRWDGRPYSDEDQRFADSLCRHIGGLLGNDQLARNISDDLAMSDPGEIYDRLDDHGLPSQEIPGLEYGGQCDRAGETGGDLFDLLPSGKHELVLAVGRVDARGVPAGILVGGVLGTVRALAGRREPLDRIAGELNRTLWEMAPEGRFTSFLCARVEPSNRCLRYVNAGHEPGLLLRARGGPVERLEATGAVMGLSRRSAYRERTVLFEPGDMVAAFTESVVEPGGPDGVARILREGEGCGVQELAAQVLAEGQPESDRTVVLVRFRNAMAEPLPIARAALAAA